jgi:hypothetical protein
VDAAPTQPPPPPAPPVASAELAPTVVGVKKRRLHILEQQQARKGHNAPPEIIMEIDDLRRELGEAGSKSN